MDQTYMKKQNILKLLLTMALPMVISMLVNSLYNIVDSFFVAKISENAMIKHMWIFLDVSIFRHIAYGLCGFFVLIILLLCYFISIN
jgi:Na+-driven multidrug efflux pump